MSDGEEIENNIFYLSNHLTNVEETLLHLLNEKIISSSEHEDFSDRKPSTVLNTKIFLLLKRKDWNIVGEAVLKILRNTGNEHCADKISPKQKNDKGKITISDDNGNEIKIDAASLIASFNQVRRGVQVNNALTNPTGGVKYETSNGVQQSSNGNDTLNLVNSAGGIERLVASMKQLLETGTDSDVTLIARRKRFLVHKAILKSQSPIFQIMFDGNNVRGNIIRINGFTEKAVAGLLSYIYTGRVDNVSENPMELIKIAHKYSVEGLKEDAQIAMMNNINVQNAAETLLAAHLSNAGKLKEKVLDFMRQNKAEVKNTEGWRKATTENPQDFIDAQL